MSPSPADPVTLALTGMLPFVVLAGAALALPTSFLLLWLYRRAVVRAMSQLGGAGGAPPVQAPGVPGASVPLEIVCFDATSAGDAAQTASPSFRDAVAGPWRAARVYAAAGGVFSAVLTACWLAATHDPSLGVVKLHLLWWLYAWPAVLAVNLCAVSERSLQWRVIGGYFAGFALLSGLALLRSPELTVGQVVTLWLVTNAPATLLLYAFLARPIRAVGPLVLVFGIVALTGSQLTLSLLGASDRGMRAVVYLSGRLGMGGVQAFWGTFAAGLLVFAVLGSLLLRWLASRYAAKRLSDESLALDAVFLLFGVVQSIGLVFEGWYWIASGPAAFVAYKLAGAAGFRALRPARAPKTLLLLRVFALGRRSERFFAALRKRWLRAGNIVMIAGPDLVNANIEPDEFLGFVSGHLGRRFVEGEEDLDRRLRVVDRQPDPDRRFRVTEFFCRADTWQATMRRLAKESDAVLMDLRSFSPSNQGCLYELGALLEAIDLDRVLFVVDASTDRGSLEEALRRLWGNVDAGSANRAKVRPTARLFEAPAVTAETMRALLALLTGSRQPPEAARWPGGGTTSLDPPPSFGGTTEAVDSGLQVHLTKG